MTNVTAEKEQEELEKKCWSRLMLIKDAKVLEEICTALEIEIPPGHASKTNFLCKLLLRKLNSEEIQNSEDHGCAYFLKCWDVLREYPPHL